MAEITDEARRLVGEVVGDELGGRPVGERVGEDVGPVGPVADLEVEAVLAAIAEWRTALSAVGASYEVVMSNEPFGIPLRRAFAIRQRLP